MIEIISLTSVLETSDVPLADVRTHAPGPAGRLPLTAEMLLGEPSGNLFGLSMNVGMGWSPDSLSGPEILLLSTHGGLRAEDGTPIALGFHTGHWEVGLLVGEAARELRALGAVPFSGACTDPCDGRTQGTTGMFDSLPYRNDAAVVFRRLIRSLPTRKGVVGIATCDKGLPAMMMALAAMGDLPTVLVPGGVSLLPRSGRRCRPRTNHRRTLCAPANHAGVRGGSRMPRLCDSRRRLSVLGYGRDFPGGGGGFGAGIAAHGLGSFRPTRLAGYGEAVRESGASAEPAGAEDR